LLGNCKRVRFSIGVLISADSALLCAVLDHASAVSFSRLRINRREKNEDSHRGPLRKSKLNNTLFSWSEKQKGRLIGSGLLMNSQIGKIRFGTSINSSATLNSRRLRQIYSASSARNPRQR